MVLGVVLTVESGFLVASVVSSRVNVSLEELVDVSRPYCCKSELDAELVEVVVASCSFRALRAICVVISRMD
ncbi:hypothetical protein D3C87_1993290 [compost metagenome]